MYGDIIHGTPAEPGCNTTTHISQRNVDHTGHLRPASRGVRLTNSSDSRRQIMKDKDKDDDDS